MSLLFAFGTSITASAEHRQLATLDTSARAAADEAITQLQQQATALFGPCTAGTDNQPDNVTFTMPSGYSASITQEQYWDPQTSQFVNSCTQATEWPPALNPPNPPQSQLIGITVTPTSGNPVTVQTVVDNPSAYPVAGATAAASLVFVQQPGNATKDSPFGTQPTVEVLSANGNIDYSDMSPIDLTIVSGTGAAGAVLSNCDGTPDYGVLTFTGCSINEINSLANPYVLQANNGSFTATSSPFNVTAGPPAQLVLSGPTSGTASSTANIGPFTVTEEDSAGDPTTAAETVNLTSTTQGTPSFSTTLNGGATTSVTIPAGSSTATFYYGDTKSGSPTITASDAALSLTSGHQTETISGGTAAKLAVTSPPFTAAQGTWATSQFTITLEDTFGNPTTRTGTTTVNLASTSSGAKFATTSGGGSATSVTLPANTQSVNAYYADTTIGTPTITASTTVTGISSGTQQETIVGAPTKLVITSAPVSGAASSSATLGPITVKEETATGAATTLAETVTLSSSSTGGTFAATSGGAAITTVNIPAGSSTATFYYGDTKAGTPTITAASGTLTSGTQVETINGGSPAKLAITSTAFTATASNQATNGFTVTLEDTQWQPDRKHHGPHPEPLLYFVGSGVRRHLGWWFGSERDAARQHPVRDRLLQRHRPGIADHHRLDHHDPRDRERNPGRDHQRGDRHQAGHYLGPVHGGPGDIGDESVHHHPRGHVRQPHDEDRDHHGQPGFDLVGSQVRGHLGWGLGDERHTPGQHAVRERLLRGHDHRNPDDHRLDHGDRDLEWHPARDHRRSTHQAGDHLGTGLGRGVLERNSRSDHREGGDSHRRGDDPGRDSHLVLFVDGRHVRGDLGGAAITTVNIPAGSSTATFYYGDTKAGTPTITAASGTLTSGTQVETINGGSPAKLAITSTASTATASNQATNGFTVTLEDTYGNPTTNTTALTLNLSSTSSGAAFAATSGGGSVPSVTLPANTQSVTAYYSDTVQGSPTITVSTTTIPTIANGTQVETINAGTGTKLVITSAPFTAAQGTSATSQFTITLEDAFGNPTTRTGTTTVNLASTSSGAKFRGHLGWGLGDERRTSRPTRSP